MALISSSKRQLVFRTIIYLCGFLLLWEWLRPLETLTDTGSLSAFVIYTGFCFIISVLNMKWWLSIPLKLGGLLFVLDGLFISEAMFSKGWFYLLYLHVQYNLEMISSQNWTEITPLFRSLLFLVLLWLMSYLMYYWFVISKRIFLFVLLTFIYLTVLDTFTVYEANTAIVRAFIVSLIALGVSNFYKELGREAMTFTGLKRVSAWVLPLAAVIVFSSLVGFAAPKLDPQWPDPVPYLTSTSPDAGFGEDGTGGVQKVGYGEDDSRLGGSFVQDDSLVFQAQVEEKHYWRIETKDIYTGKGWERSTEPEYNLTSDGSVDFHTFENSVETKSLQGIVTFQSNAFFSKLVYPYGIKQVDGEEDVNYLVDEEFGSIAVEAPEQQGIVDQYQISYDNPSFSIDLLSEANGEDPQAIKDKYLQLPDNLPNRVGNLASQIISEEETRYDQVKAVEQYFNRNGFVYQTEDVAVPGRNQDYVDQFLFETKAGYCDNYSTSMTVMLRTLDIPARWVKGFTGGDLAPASDDSIEGLNNYKVTNSNAHSWVEVYFPEVGWVPFEPTQGFSNPVDFYQDVNQQQDSPDTDETAEQEEQERPGNQQEVGMEEDEAASDDNPKVQLADGWSWTVAIVAAVLLAVAVILFLTRYHWMSVWIRRKFHHQQNPQMYQEAYLFLLKLLNHKGLGRQEGQTLREYAFQVDKRFESQDMVRLTHQYERMLYRNETDSAQWGNITELWENLIKRALS
ncbi:transglutaminase TgpA family protein [Sediminibacillus halophilus]|uniref:Transglutaminase-like enzyme, putative cysteine protease n=1 Tax=Sediminibacillus halophilus TaxID=482461 RepID=A0A1G9V162_9BACI|nr:transglutaminase domain-containing protein [Sediminibacillus halophilus]SDM65777.1 Transglutaminase-like enzyme, putative cysteine protease [Sediminibacillus halophilus]